MQYRRGASVEVGAKHRELTLALAWLHPSKAFADGIVRTIGAQFDFRSLAQGLKNNRFDARFWSRNAISVAVAVDQSGFHHEPIPMNVCFLYAGGEAHLT